MAESCVLLRTQQRRRRLDRRHVDPLNPQKPASKEGCSLPKKPAPPGKARRTQRPMRSSQKRLLSFDRPARAKSGRVLLRGQACRDATRMAARSHCYRRRTSRFRNHGKPDGSCQTVSEGMLRGKTTQRRCMRRPWRWLYLRPRTANSTGFGIQAAREGLLTEVRDFVLSLGFTP